MYTCVCAHASTGEKNFLFLDNEAKMSSLFYNACCRNKEPEQCCLSSLGL